MEHLGFSHCNGKLFQKEKDGMWANSGCVKVSSKREPEPDGEEVE